MLFVVVGQKGGCKQCGSGMSIVFKYPDDYPVSLDGHSFYNLLSTIYFRTDLIPINFISQKGGYIYGDLFFASLIIFKFFLVLKTMKNDILWT